LLHLTLACVRCEPTIEAAEDLLLTASKHAGAQAVSAIQFSSAHHAEALASAHAPSRLDCGAANWLHAQWRRSSRRRPMLLTAPQSLALPSANVLLHGHREFSGLTTLVCFFGVPTNNSTLAELITPHLHNLLLRLRRAGWLNLSAFTSAEHSIITHLVLGGSNKQIARALGKSETTIRNQLHRMYLKLGVGRRIDAIRMLEHLMLVDAQ
jgi:DNA-binding CsgD family transcriptional regulator